MNFENYCKGLEKLFNQDDEVLKRVAFDIFDLNNDKKVSENDIFELIKITSFIKGGYFKNPDPNLHLKQKVLPLN